MSSERWARPELASDRVCITVRMWSTAATAERDIRPISSVPLSARRSRRSPAAIADITASSAARRREKIRATVRASAPASRMPAISVRMIVVRAWEAAERASAAAAAALSLERVLSSSMCLTASVMAGFSLVVRMFCHSSTLPAAFAATAWVRYSRYPSHSAWTWAIADFSAALTGRLP